MPINFHDEHNRYTYTTRDATASWKEAIQKIVDVRGKQVLDAGCGGGIYSRALIDMGAAHVTGLDFSAEILQGARESCKDYPNIDFVQDDATNTGLADDQFDIVLVRAVIHHLGSHGGVDYGNIEKCLKEVFRLLRDEGTLIVQDRTTEDALLTGSPSNIRGYFFERYPRLRENEAARRPEGSRVLQPLKDAGFQTIHEQQLWETETVYPDIDALSENLLQRTGRSILHELTNEELQDLVMYIRGKLEGHTGEIVEQDRWTIWWGMKK